MREGDTSVTVRFWQIGRDGSQVHLSDVPEGTPLVDALERAGRVVAKGDVVLPLPAAKLPAEIAYTDGWSEAVEQSLRSHLVTRPLQRVWRGKPSGFTVLHGSEVPPAEVDPARPAETPGRPADRIIALPEPPRFATCSECGERLTYADLIERQVVQCFRPGCGRLSHGAHAAGEVPPCGHQYRDLAIINDFPAEARAWGASFSEGAGHGLTPALRTDEKRYVGLGDDQYERVMARLSRTRAGVASNGDVVTGLRSDLELWTGLGIDLPPELDWGGVRYRIFCAPDPGMILSRKGVSAVMLDLRRVRVFAQGRISVETAESGLRWRIVPAVGGWDVARRHVAALLRKTGLAGPSAHTGTAAEARRESPLW
ncbi:hypothetical protein OHV05_37070 (plasmid) [Kitasatospora sp. NBC_00070]|uniref:hypothetical protein n=1 Tax=Kitasatospora sp. NBC_00070 TaxID=2975962 RepID=UPI00324824CF